jgi:hypothetical protein
MSSSANSVDTDSSSLSRQDNKRPYTPDSPPPENKRPRISLDSSAADDRVQLPPIHSLRDHHLTDARRASLPTLYSENPARLSKSYPAPARSPYHHSPSLTSYQFPPALDHEDKFRPRLESSASFNPYTSYSTSSATATTNSFPSSYNFTSPLSPPPSQAGPQSNNGYLASTHSWSAPSPHLSRPSSNPETDRHPPSKSEQQLESWTLQQYSQSGSLTNGSKHPAPPVSSLPAPAAAMAERPKGKRGKLPKPVTDYLKDWLHRHSDHPYPSEDEKKQLCQATGLSMSQVSNWMINVR